MTQATPNCPTCGSAFIVFRARRQEYECEDCGHRWPLQSASLGLQWPPGLEPESLPTYLAAPLASQLSEPHPRVRLHWLVDCAEIAVRWSVAVALAEVLHANAGALPSPVIERIRDQIERPTLGKWLGMLEALSAEPRYAALLAPGVFTLYRDVFAPAFRGEGEGGTPETSLLVLRNHLAHGGGLRTETARELLATHELGVFDLLRAVAQTTAGTEVIAVTGDQARRLAGPEPTGIPCPAALQDVPDGPWLVGAAGTLPLLPLADFAPVRRIGTSGRLEERPGGPAAQIYLRADRQRLTYVPVAGDEPVAYVIDVEAFRALFRLDARTGTLRPAGDAFHWQDFLREARVLQEDLIGRTAELAAIKGWIKGRDTRQDGVAALGWVFGGPGLGKSLLMAKVAADLGGSKPGQQGLYYHRFRAGDARNSLRAFLNGLLAALDDWSPLPAAERDDRADEGPDTDQALLDAARKRLEAVARLPPPNPQAPPPRFLVLVDGLDEVLPYEPRLPMRLRDLVLPGTLWLLAGRPEPALQQAFSAPGCERLFDNGLPPMSATDIRAMLVEGLANSRHALIARDQDTEEGVRNPFVERVVACADGLPLYVHLLLEDLRDGRLTVHDEQRLPPGLVAYYDALIDRIGISDLKRDLTLLVAVLARAEEPLDAEALALLLADVPEDAPRYRERVENAHRGGQALLRTAPTADGREGLTLYHQSFRDYVGGRPARNGEPAIDPAPALAGTVRDAEAKLCRLAGDWAELPEGNLRNHLFRWGVRYALLWQGEAGLEAARGRLTNFGYLHSRIETLGTTTVFSILDDLHRLPAESDSVQQGWITFLKSRAHIISRGGGMPFIQCAVASTPSSTVAREAEKWLSRGNHPAHWLRPRPFLRAQCPEISLQGHSAPVRRIELTPDGQLLVSCDEQGTLGVWDITTGRCLRWIQEASAQFALLAPDGRRAVSAKIDPRLCASRPTHLVVWDLDTGQLTTNLIGHIGFLKELVVHPDRKHILTASDDGTARVWNMETFECDQVLLHGSSVSYLTVLADGRRAVTCSKDAIKVWDIETGTCEWAQCKEFDSDHFTYMTIDGRYALLAGARVVTHEVIDRSTGKSLWRWRQEYQHLHFPSPSSPHPLLRHAFDRTGLYLILATEHDAQLDYDYENYREHGQRIPGPDVSVIIADLSTGTSVAIERALLKDVQFFVEIPELSCMLTIDEKGHLALWDLGIAKQAQKLPAWLDCIGAYPGDAVSRLVLHPDGRHLVCLDPINPQSWQVDGIVGFWSLKSGGFFDSNDNEFWDLKEDPLLADRCILCAPEHEYEYRCELSDLIRPPSTDGRWEVWDIAERRIASPEASASVFRDYLQPKSCSDKTPPPITHPDGNRVIRCEGNSIHVEDSQQQEPTLSASRASSVVCLALAVRGSIAVTGHADGNVRVWDMKGEHVRTLRGSKALAEFVALDLTGQCVFSMDGDRTLRRWEAETGRLQFEIPRSNNYERGYETSCVGLSSTLDGSSILFGSNHHDNGYVHSPHCEDPRRQWSTLWYQYGSTYRHEIISRFASQGFFLLSDCDVGSVDDCPSIRCLAIHPEGECAVEYSDSMDLSIWNIDENIEEPIARIALDEESVVLLGSALTRRREEDYKVIANLGVSGSYTVFDAQSAKRLEPHDDKRLEAGVWRILLVGAGSPFEGLIGDVETTVPTTTAVFLRIWEIARHTLSVRVSSDLRWIAGLTDMQTLKLWRLEDGSCVGRWDSDAAITGYAVDSSARVVVGDTEGNVVFLQLVS